MVVPDATEGVLAKVVLAKVVLAEGVLAKGAAGGAGLRQPSRRSRRG